MSFIFINEMFLLILCVVPVGDFISDLILWVVFLCLVYLCLGVEPVVLWSNHFLLAASLGRNWMVIVGRGGRSCLGLLV